MVPHHSTRGIEAPSKCRGGGGLMVCLNRLPHYSVNINLQWKETRLKRKKPDSRGGITPAKDKAQDGMEGVDERGGMCKKVRGE